MKHLFCLLILVISAPLLATDVAIINCQKRDKGINFIKTTIDSKVSLNATFTEVDIPADFCETKAELTDLIKENISEVENVVGACVSITSNSGDGEIAILRLIDGTYSAEMKTIMVDYPSLEKGQSIECVE
jgi:hypothetical protein